MEHQFLCEFSPRSMKTHANIYLDHQATTPVDQRVLADMLPLFENDYGNPHSKDHAVGWTASAVVDKAAERIALLVGSDRDEVVFTSGATEANNLALLGLCRRNSDTARRRVLLSSIEHKSVLATGRILQDRLGYDVELLPVDQDGRISISDLDRSLREDVLLVSIMAVNNEIGTVQDMDGIAARVKTAGALFHCDAAQAPLAMDLSSLMRKVDLASLSSHKMGGPMGIGALIARRELRGLIEPLIYGGGQQGGLRSGTLPLPLCVGMGKAAEICSSDSASVERQRIAALRDAFADRLSRLSSAISINGPAPAHRHPGNVNMLFKGFPAADVLGLLQPHLAASTGSACTSGHEEPSHVLAAIGLSNEDAASSIRFSLGAETTKEELDRAIDLIGGALDTIGKDQELREPSIRS